LKVRSIALLFLSLAPALLADAAERPKEIRALVDAAPVAPPELAADILIRIVESGRVTDPAWKLELLDQAFHMAGAAKYPVALSAAVARALNTDSDPGVRSGALHAKLDALSLRCRAVSGTLALDRKKAVALFREIPILQFPAHTCADSMRELPDIVFETLGQVFAQAFTPQERAKGKHVDFAEEYLGGLTSPTQLEPAIRMIAAQKLTSDELARLTGVLVASIQQLNSDDRTFTAVTNPGLIDEVLTFADRCRQSGYSPQSLVASFRAYLVRHFQAARCAESPKAYSGGRLAETFNQMLVPLAGEGAVAPITPDEMKPGPESDGGLQAFALWHGRTAGAQQREGHASRSHGPVSDRGTKKHARMASRGAGVSEQTRGVETGQRRTRGVLLPRGLLHVCRIARYSAVRLVARTRAAQLHRFPEEL
jgi:hypothetical protein